MTKQQFLDGEVFEYQNARAFQYRFKMDIGETTMGLLIPVHRGLPLSAYMITENGFRAMVGGHPKFISYEELNLVKGDRS